MDKLTVFGNPIAHSLSPQIHQLFAQQTGRQISYTRHLTTSPQFSAAVASFFRGGGVGANVTLPFKESAYYLATHLTRRAFEAKAVNTLVPLGHGQLLGDNTDGHGLVHDLQRYVPRLQGLEVLLLGAGGAAHGVVAPLLAAGVAKITVVNRTLTRAQQLRDYFSDERIHVSSYESLMQPQGNYCIINATSASLAGIQLPIPEAIYAGAQLAYDMMYGAQPTVFMRQAKTAGSAQVVDGLGMLVEQAALAFQLWFGESRVLTEPVIAQLRANL